MKIDVTVCYSLIEMCIDQINPFDPQTLGNKLLQEIQRRKINLTDELEKHYENYFLNRRQDLLDSYQQFMSAILYSEHVNIMDDSFTPHSAVRNLINDAYQQTACGVCYNTGDKILVSDLPGGWPSGIATLGINVLGSDDILDQTKDNLLNLYRLPIVRKRIPKGMSNSDLSNWLSRFIKTENDIEMIDGYIFENRDVFLNHFLVHVPKGATIRLYTLKKKPSVQSQMITEFTSGHFRDWNIEIYTIPMKSEQHARNIFTNQYFIHICKGMAVFGSSGLTDQADITVQYRNLVNDKSMPIATKIL